MELSKALQEQGKAFGMLVIAPTGRLLEMQTEAMSYFAARGIPGVFVTFSKPHATLENELQRKKLDLSRVFFIDTIENNAHGREDRALHVQSPSALTDISIAISQFAYSVPNDRFVIIDALNALRVYNDDGDVARFVGALTAKSAVLQLQLVMFAIKDPATESLQRTIFPFFERVIELG